MKSRTFWLLLIAMAMAFALSWDQKDSLYFVTVTNIGIGGWISGKFLEAKAKNGGGA